MRIIAQAIRYSDKQAAESQRLLLLILSGKPAAAQHVQLFVDAAMRTPEVETEEALLALNESKEDQKKNTHAPFASFPDKRKTRSQATGGRVYAQLDLCIRVHLPGDGKRPGKLPQLGVTAIGGRRGALWAERTSKGIRDDATGNAVVAVGTSVELEDAVFDWEDTHSGRDVQEVSVEMDDEDLREDLRAVVRGCCRDYFEDDCPEEVGVPANPKNPRARPRSVQN